MVTTINRVQRNTNEAINRRIEAATGERIRRLARHPLAIERRLRELDREWDIERVLETNAALIALAGIAMAARLDRRWLMLPALVTTFLFQHAVQGWCPPIPLLRRLLTEPVVTHDGEFDHITGAGLAPLPHQRPIPIWIGGQSAPAYRRIGRLADGWFPQVIPGPALDEARAIVADAATEAGRDPAVLGMEGRVSWTSDGVDKIVDHLGRWRDAGATHVAVNTMNAGLGPVDAHLEVLADVASALSLSK